MRNFVGINIGSTVLIKSELDFTEVERRLLVDCYNSNIFKYIGTECRVSSYGCSDDLFLINLQDGCLVRVPIFAIKEVLSVTISEDLYDILSDVNIDKASDLIKTRKNKSDMDYIDIALSDQCKLSYIKEDRKSRFKNGNYMDKDLRKKYAYMGKVGKTLNKINKDIQFTTNEIERIQGYLIQRLNPEFYIAETLEEIKDVYYGWHYCECQSIGTLDTSCMKHEDCQDFFDIYVDNAKVLYTKCDCGNITARALLWDNVSVVGTDKTIKLMDRIYGNNAMIEVFKVYAKENGYYHKETQSVGEKCIINGADKINTTLLVNLKHEMDIEKLYPYLDTFSALFTDFKTISNINSFHAEKREIKTQFHLLNETEGEIRSISCNDCGSVISMRNAIDINGKLTCSSCAIMDHDYGYCDSTHGYYPNSELETCTICGSSHLIKSNYIKDGLCKKCIALKIKKDFDDKNRGSFSIVEDVVTPNVEDVDNEVSAFSSYRVFPR